ncbi:MAG: DUF2442 domain-containing protein [Bacteroidota bacterium]
MSSVIGIVSIVNLQGYKVTCLFDNGEERVIDFERLLRKWNAKKDKRLSQLLVSENFEQIKVQEDTLAWPNIRIRTKLSNGKSFDLPLDLDPVVLYNESELGSQQKESLLEIKT